MFIASLNLVASHRKSWSLRVYLLFLVGKPTITQTLSHKSTIMVLCKMLQQVCVNFKFFARFLLAMRQPYCHCRTMSLVSAKIRKKISNADFWQPDCVCEQGQFRCQSKLVQKSAMPTRVHWRAESAPQLYDCARMLAWQKIKAMQVKRHQESILAQHLCIYMCIFT